MAGVFVQSDFYGQWLRDAASATYTSNQTLSSVVEFVKVDTSGGVVQIELPDSSGTDVEDTKKIWIIDEGSAGTNNITVIPNASDSTTIQGDSQYYLTVDDQIVIFELVDTQWLVIADSVAPILNLGAFSMHRNATTTVISVTNTYTDVLGTAVGSSLNSNFTFGTSPNDLTYIGRNDITVSLSVAFTMSKTNSSNKIFRIAAFKNGTEISGHNIGTNILKEMLEV